MIRFALKGILGRKLRTALTAIAVVLGVAMVSSTYVLTDSIDKAFNAIFTEVYRGTDASDHAEVRIRHRGRIRIDGGTFDESLLARVKGLPGVANAIGGVSSENAQLIKGDKAIVFGGAPNLGFSVDPSKPEFNSLTLKEGAWPKGDQVVIDVSTADKKHLKVGDDIGVQVEGPVHTLKISGFVKFGSVSTIGGATLAGFDLSTAQKLFDKDGKLDQIRVAAKKGVMPQQLVSQIQRILPPEPRSGQVTPRRPRTPRTRISSSRSFATSSLPSG